MHLGVVKNLKDEVNTSRQLPGPPPQQGASDPISGVTGLLACVASVSVRFRRKERGTRVKDRAKNGASLLFHILALVSFLARSKPKVRFLGFSLLRNQTETLATQATGLCVYLFYPNLFPSQINTVSPKK